MPPSEKSPLPRSELAAVQPALAARRSRRKRLVVSLLIVMLLAGAAAAYWWFKPGTDNASAPTTGPAGPGGPGASTGRRGPPPSTVGVARAETARVPVLLDALGTVTPLATVKLRPQVSGVLEKILFKEGQMVRAGELLATIDARQFQLALQQASGQRQRDEAQLASARVTLARYKTLLEQDSIARQEVDTQAALVQQLEGTVLVDKAAEGAARLNLSYTRLTAPVSGRIGLRSADVGNLVASSDTLALITQLSPMDVVFALPQDQASALQQSLAQGKAMPVTALDRTRSSVLETGSLASLDNQIDTTTGTVKAKARFANTALALFPNQFVNVQLQVNNLDKAVLVPVSALRLGSAGDYVYVLQANRTVALRPVQRGPASGDKIVITSGLQAGEQVISEGADRLKDGATVMLAGDAPSRGKDGAGGWAGKRRQGASAAAAAASSGLAASDAKPWRMPNRPQPLAAP